MLEEECSEGDRSRGRLRWPVRPRWRCAGCVVGGIGGMIGGMIVGIAAMTAGIGAGFAEQRGSGWRLPLHRSDGVSRRPA